MHGPTWIFWASLTPFSLQFELVGTLQGWRRNVPAALALCAGSCLLAAARPVVQNVDKVG
jgi:hypothetical protein